MCSIKVVYSGRINNTVVCLATIPEIGFEKNWPISNGSFFSAVLLAEQNKQHPFEMFFSFARSAIIAGARQLIAVGDTADVIHELFDEEICEIQIAESSLLQKDDIIMTEGFKNKSLRTVVFDAVCSFKCAEKYLGKDNPVVFVVLENDPRKEHLIDLLKEGAVTGGLLPD